MDYWSMGTSWNDHLRSKSWAVPLPASHGNHETRGKLLVVKHFQFSGWISWIPWIIFSWKSSNNCFLCCILNTNTYSAPIVSTRSIISILSHIRCGVQPMSLSGLSSIVPSCTKWRYTLTASLVKKNAKILPTCSKQLHFIARPCCTKCIPWTLPPWAAVASPGALFYTSTWRRITSSCWSRWMTRSSWSWYWGFQLRNSYNLEFLSYKRC